VTTRTIDRIETARLVCERLQRDHERDLSALLRDPRVAPMTWPRPAGPTEVEISINLAAKLDHWERYGFGMWLLRDRATGAMVGRGGLQWTHATGVDEVEAGWAIVPDRWGRGLATEMALLAVDVGLRDLDLRSIIAFTLPHNVASRRVMEKAGFVYERAIVYVDLAHVLYRRARD
jgi:[ribosomal protein S5]-alanine N-acetyltransferase